MQNLYLVSSNLNNVMVRIYSQHMGIKIKKHSLYYLQELQGNPPKVHMALQKSSGHIPKTTTPTGERAINYNL